MLGPGNGDGIEFETLACHFVGGSVEVGKYVLGLFRIEDIFPQGVIFWGL